MRRLTHLPFYLVGALIVIVLSSCGTLKRAVDKTKEKENVVSDQTTKTTEATTSSLTTSITRTTTESFETDIEVKADSAKGEISLQDLFDGETIESETDGVKILVRYDSTTKKIKGVATKKKQVIPVKGEKKTVENISQDQLTNSKKTTDDKKHLQSSKVSKNKTVASEAKSGINWTFIILFLICLVIALIYLYRRFS